MHGKFSPEVIAEMGGAGQALASVLFTDYLLPFEISGFLLLAAAVGAMILARSPDEDEMPDSTDPVADAAGPAIAAEGGALRRG